MSPQPNRRLAPDTLIARTYFARGALLWTSTRALLSAVLFLGQLDPVRLSLGAIFLVVTSVVGLGAADIHRRHERALVENLGLSRATLIVFFGLPALLGEFAIGMAAAMLT